MGPSQARCLLARGSLRSMRTDWPARDDLGGAVRRDDGGGVGGRRDAWCGDCFPPRRRTGSVAMSSGRDSPSSGRCKVLPRAITRSSLAWDRRRGATCVLGVIRQIIHAPARDERRACGPYQKGTRSGVVKTPGQSTGQPGRGMAEPPHCRRRQQRSRISSTSRDRHPRRRQRRHAGKVM